MTVDKWTNVVDHIWKLLRKAREADGIMETRVEDLIISLGGQDDSSSDSSDEAEEVDIYEDCGVFPLD